MDQSKDFFTLQNIVCFLVTINLFFIKYRTKRLLLLYDEKEYVYTSTGKNEMKKKYTYKMFLLFKIILRLFLFFFMVWNVSDVHGFFFYYYMIPFYLNYLLFHSIYVFLLVGSNGIVLPLS